MVNPSAMCLAPSTISVCCRHSGGTDSGRCAWPASMPWKRESVWARFTPESCLGLVQRGVCKMVFSILHINLVNKILIYSKGAELCYIFYIFGIFVLRLQVCGMVNS